MAYKANSTYRLVDNHTIRAGFYIQTDHALSDTTSQVLAVDDNGNQTSDVPVSVVDNGTKTAWSYSAYIQDEWKPLPDFTINYGVRFDSFQAFDSENQVSPRINFVWQPAEGTALHIGYARYFSPPPFELVGNETVGLFANTTAAPALTQNDTPKAERANYFDAGAQQKVGMVTLGVDSYYKISQNMIDEGQFGAPIILTPFNCHEGFQLSVR